MKCLLEWAFSEFVGVGWGGVGGGGDQHPPAHHPPHNPYDSVMDQPQLS